VFCFAFDKRRRAILLLGGDKSNNWDGWYRKNIPIADDRFEEHQAEIDRQRAVERTPKGSAAAEGISRKGNE
jgi:hypothetical protein